MVQTLMGGVRQNHSNCDVAVKKSPKPLLSWSTDVWARGHEQVDGRLELAKPGTILGV